MRIAVIGCGVMGSAFMKQFAKEHQLFLYDRHRQKREALAAAVQGEAVSSLREAVSRAELVLLAIKPKDLAAVAEEVKGVDLDGKWVLSVLTGASTTLLKSYFPRAQVIRAMPNLGVVCQRGVIGLVQDPDLEEATQAGVTALMQGMGLSVWMPEERIDALIALSGSGIGFVFVLIEAMIDGGIFLGFNAQQSRDLVLETFRGAVALMEQSGKHPAELKQQVSSPGGTTIAGLKVMEEEGVRAGLIATLNACYEKAVQITNKLNKSTT